MLTKAELRRLAKWETQVTAIVSLLREMHEAKSEALEARREKHEQRSETWLESEAGQAATTKLEESESQLYELVEQVADDLENAIAPLLDVEQLIED